VGDRVHGAAVLGGGVGRVGHRGRAMHVDPIKPKLKAPGSKCLQLKYDIPLSTSAFKFNLRRYIVEAGGQVVPEVGRCSLPPIKSTLKAPETKRWKLKCDVPLSNFAFNFNLRRYTEDEKLNPKSLAEALAKLAALRFTRQRKSGWCISRQLWRMGSDGETIEAMERYSLIPAVVKTQVGWCEFEPALKAPDFSACNQNTTYCYDI